MFINACIIVVIGIIHHWFFIVPDSAWSRFVSMLPYSLCCLHHCQKLQHDTVYQL